MEDAIFLITHLAMALCCFVIFGIGINFGKEKTVQTERKKKTLLCADGLANEIVSAESVIGSAGFQLAAN